MLSTIFQYVSAVLLVGVACAVLLEIARIARQLFADRRADRIRIRQLIEEVELRQRDARDRTNVSEVVAEPIPSSTTKTDANTVANSEAVDEKVQVRRPRDVTASTAAKAEPSGQAKLNAPPPAWQGTRQFRVVQKLAECDGCQSLYLVPVDGQPLPLYLPGQFLTLNVKIPGQAKSTVRCYSLSEEPNQEFYRCTIKKIAADPMRLDLPPGLMSNHLHTSTIPGELIDVGAPRGSFFLDMFSERPVVLIAAGIGITPLLSMLNTLIHTGFTKSIHLFFGVRNGAEHPFRKHLSKLALQHAKLFVVTAYSQPLPQDQWSLDYQVRGRLDLELVKQTVNNVDSDFYICGPGSFMQTMVTGLREWGVSDDQIRFEAFGPSTVAVAKNESDGVADKAIPSVRSTTAAAKDASNARSLTVSFARSGKSLVWNGAVESLLEFAEQNGIKIESGCRSGNCGTCTTSIKSGAVEYHDHADPACEADHCLPCVCTPGESLVLDA